MKCLRPHTHNVLQSTASRLWRPASATLKQFHSIHYKAGDNVTHNIQTFSGNGARINATSHQISAQRQISSQRVLDPRLTGSNHRLRSMQSSPANTLLRPGQGRASYGTESGASGEPVIHSVFETKTSTWQYVVADPSSSTAVIIDPVLDYDPATQSITTHSADSLLSLVKEKGYKIEKILETHAHADHLTAASYLQSRLAKEQGHRPPIGIGKRIGKVQQLFGQKYGISADEYEGVFDELFDDAGTFDVGGLKASVIHLPGHTPDHVGYKIGDNVFCGDSIFHADIGTARCDFPGGSACHLFESGRKLLALPDNVKIWTGHDYPPDERGAPAAWMSVADHRERNKHLRDGISQEEFVALRSQRDATLAAPRLLHQSLQMNIRAGHLPKPTASGDRLLHLPLKLNGVEW
ncbi:hypothetical protein AAE478_007942 [Parahypoxylon ruwenzoriense]